MAEYIERGELFKNLNQFAPEAFNELINMLIRNQPAADVQEVRHGKWEQCFEDWRKQIEGDKCSVCGFEYYGTSIRHYHYCPNCGAKMDKEREKND